MTTPARSSRLPAVVAGLLAAIEAPAQAVDTKTQVSCGWPGGVVTRTHIYTGRLAFSHGNAAINAATHSKGETGQISLHIYIGRPGKNDQAVVEGVLRPAGRRRGRDPDQRSSRASASMASTRSGSTRRRSASACPRTTTAVPSTPRSASPTPPASRAPRRSAAPQPTRRPRWAPRSHLFGPFDEVAFDVGFGVDRTTLIVQRGEEIEVDSEIANGTPASGEPTTSTTTPAPPACWPRRATGRRRRRSTPRRSSPTRTPHTTRP